MDQGGYPSEDIRVRMAKALNRCKALRPIWATRPLTQAVAAKARVLRNCAFAGLVYGLRTLYTNDNWTRRIDALEINCLRKGARNQFHTRV